MTGEHDDYKRGYREGYQDGMDAARKELNPLLPVVPVLPHVNTVSKCKLCNIVQSGAWGYVCYHPNCPTKTSCASSA